MHIYVNRYRHAYTIIYGTPERGMINIYCTHINHMFISSGALLRQTYHVRNHRLSKQSSGVCLMLPTHQKIPNLTFSAHARVGALVVQLQHQLHACLSGKHSSMHVCMSTGGRTVRRSKSMARRWYIAAFLSVFLFYFMYVGT